MKSVLVVFLMTALSEGANVGGAVLDNDSGAPISAATIQLISENGAAAETESAENGRFLFDGVTQGHYRLVPSKSGYISLFTHPSASVTVSDRGQPSPLELKLTRACFISGQVSNQDGQPARGIKVVAMARRLRGGAVRLVKAAAGAFEFPSLEPGKYQILALTGLYAGEASDPAFVANHTSLASEVEVAAKESPNVNLKVNNGH